MSDLLGLFLIGMLYGATTCSITCLPVLGPYLLNTGTGFRNGITSSLIFLNGKLAAYAAMGGVAAWFGSVLLPDKGIAKIIMGLTLIAAGIYLPFAARGKCLRERHAGRKLSLFVLGASTSLVPCPPLLALFALAAREGSLVSGVAYGSVYGLGLALSPLLIAGGGIAMISEKLRAEAKGFIPYLQGFSVLLLLVMGLRTMI